MGQLVKQVAAYAKRHALWQSGDRIVVACSGGPDSLALAHIMLRLQKKSGIKLLLGHFEHGIRGQASVDDAEFVRDFAARNSLPFFAGAADVPALARERGLSLETAAREVRYDFLHRLAREQGGALIATAHHADDQAETVLMRILRGTGIKGLAAMRPRQGNIIRPLLGIRRREIEDYCSAEALEPRQDETNLEPLYLRNRLRLELMPQLIRDYNPRLVEALDQLAEIAAEADLYLAASAGQWLVEHAAEEGEQLCFSRKEFTRISAALQAEVIKLLVGRLRLGEAISFVELQKLRDMLCEGETGRCFTLPGDWCFELCYDRVVLHRQGRATVKTPVLREWPLRVPGETVVPELGIAVRAELCEVAPADLSPDKIVVDAELLAPPYGIRLRRAGDSFAVKQGRKKVKDYFIDLKLPREKRDKIPLFTAADEIFWLGGLRQPCVAWVSRNTKRYLCLSIERNKMQEE